MTDSANIAKLLRTLAGSLLVVLSVAVLAMAQTNKATISGTVTDSQGAVVGGAKVTVKNTATGVAREVTTGTEGYYEVPLLEIGSYSVTVSKQGFSTVKRDSITLQTSTETRVDVQLQVGEITNEVIVTSEAPLVQTETSERGSVISGREITELPISGRNFTQLATLTPGVVRSSNVGVGGGPEARSFNNGDTRAGNGGPGGSNENGSTESSRFSRSGGANISANGQRATNNNFSLDGVDNNEPQFGTIGVFTNPDSIAEFKVSTSVPQAEIGRGSGAIVTVTTKSGGNAFSGSLYYYGQNSALNSYSPVLKTKLAEILATNNPNPLAVDALQKATQQIHEFGGTFGGPIIKDRTFFFFDYLGQRNNLPFPTDTAVPTAGARNGDFSQYPTIRDPRTGLAFINNQIPSARISTVGQKYLQAFPLPNLNVFSPGKFCNCNGANYFTQRSNTEEINNYRIRIDHRFNDKNSITGSFNDQRLTTLRANILPGNIPTAGFGAGEERGNTRLITVSDIHTFKPNLLNEFRFGMSEIQISIFNCGVGGACGVSPTFSRDIGIPNANDGSLEASGGLLMGAFGTGFQEFTGDGGLFQVKSKNPYFADTLTFIKGNHTIKGGGELRMRFLNTIDGGRSGALKGQFQYGDNGPATGPNAACPAGSGTTTDCFVRPDGIPYGGTGNATANILLGLPALQAGKGSINGGPFNLRSQEWGFFIQDDWKVNDRLNFNLGLRYDVFTPWSEKDGRYSLYDVSQRKILTASGGGDGIVKTDLNNFGPRVGFALALNDEKTMVIRGGYGLMYTLDGTDYPPGVRNAPNSSKTLFDQIDWGSGRIAGPAYGITLGPPPVPTAADPNNIPSGLSVYALDLDQRNGMVNQFQAEFQYQFMKDYSLSVAYVGNRANNLLYSSNIGSGGTGAARNAAGQTLGEAILYTNGARSQYDGIQVQVQKRLSNNFQGQINYTYSNTKDNSTGVFNGLGDQRTSRQGPLNPFDLNADWGNSSLDTRQLINGSVLIDLPFGKGKTYLNQGGAVNAIFGGWQMNWIVTGRTGLPFSVVSDNNGLGRPSLIGDPFKNVPNGKYLNPAAFSTTTGITTLVNGAGNTIRFGNLGRNTFRGPSQWFADMSMFKNTQLTEKFRLQLGIEFYNVFNRTNFTVPNNNIGNASSPNGDFGEIKYNAYSGRVIQYRLKLLF
ncbi:MAG: TonB-dependent receptor [Acidobacteria bacterium]|nr:TonB-dependent receptor [Acidobacteriota bacterium]